MPSLMRTHAALLSAVLGLGACTHLSPSLTTEAGAEPVLSAPRESTTPSFAAATEALVIQPFAHFATDTRQLEAAVTDLCQHIDGAADLSGQDWRPEPAGSKDPVPAASALIAAQSAWRSAALSWARAAVLATGPSLIDNRQTRINAWPVRAGLVSRQTLALTRLATDASGEELRRQVSQGSAAVQGLPALELLLFSHLPKALDAGTGPNREPVPEIRPGPDRQRGAAPATVRTRDSQTAAATPAAEQATTPAPEAACRVTLEIAGHLARTADELLADWRRWTVLQDAVSALADITPSTAAMPPTLPDLRVAALPPAALPPAFRTLQDRLLNGLLGQIRHLSRDTVGSLYTYSNDPSRLSALEYSGSRSSLAALQAALDAVRTTLSPSAGLLSSLTANPATTAAGSQDLMARLQATLLATAEAAAALPNPIENRPLTPTDIATLQALSLHIESLHRQLETQVIPSLGLTVDFNSADGD